MANRWFWNTRLKRSATVVLVVCWTLLVVELALRTAYAFLVGPSLFWYGIGEFAERNENPLGHYRKYSPRQIRFDRDSSGNVFTVVMNNHGFRGRDFAIEKPPNVIRILTLGASSTFGYRNGDTETYPYQVEQTLRRNYQGSFEVINLGIPHLESDEITALFVSEGLVLDPDVVTFYEGANDTRRGESLPAARRILMGVSDRFIVVSLLNHVISTQLNRLTYRRADLDKSLKGKTEFFLRNLSNIRRECLKRGIVFIVANQQMKSFLFERSEMQGISYAEEVRAVERKLRLGSSISYMEKFLFIHSEMMSGLEDWASTHKVPFVDIIEALDGNRDYLLSWVHLAPRANQIIAARLCAEIADQLRLKKARLAHAASKLSTPNGGT